MAVTAIKYTNSELEPLMVEAKGNKREAGFVKSFLSGVTSNLIENPEIYRSFGAYWWPLKELLIEHDVLVFGTDLEAETTEHFRYDSEELTCCAAYAMQQTKLKNNEFLASNNLLELEGGEVQEYGLYDKRMEDLTALLRFKQAK